MTCHHWSHHALPLIIRHWQSAAAMAKVESYIEKALAPSDPEAALETATTDTSAKPTNTTMTVNMSEYFSDFQESN